ncbi:MAG: sialate O-acetylesterase [Candidatus Omnitrophota bacterium]|jgi:sialate O-acetylesterase
MISNPKRKQAYLMCTHKKLWPVALLLFFLVQSSPAVEVLNVHGIFRSNMVLQRDKPITIWGWAPAGTEVQVSLGALSAKGQATGDAGRWQVVFEPQAANASPQSIIVKAGDETIQLDNVVIGDLWVMNGQSNMAFALKAVYDGAFEASMAHLPLLRHIRINSGAESEIVETDLKDAFINNQDTNKNWQAVTPEVALEMGAIGYIFGSRLQRSLQVPIGIIDNSRGGASLESLVPRHKFAEHPMAAEYLAWVDARRAAFSEEAFRQEQLDKWKASHSKWEKDVADDKAKGQVKNRREPRKPDGSIRTWSVPGRSPSDAAACYNGMFGVFKGLNIKGVAFHQGYNNAMMNSSCKPKFYRILMKLMVEGWREDFNDPQLPVAVIGLCAGGQAQTRLNFEQQGLSPAAYIREAQRLGLVDAGDTEHTAYIPAYDERIPQLHTKKKKALGLRSARWALKTIYGQDGIDWETATLLSVEPEDGKLLLSFDAPVLPDDFGSELEGFSVADASGVFYMAEAVAKPSKDKNEKNKQILVSSPLVKDPAFVRYAWARSPMGNLKVKGLPWLPLYSFRTDTIDFSPEVTHQDPDGAKKNGEAIKVLKAEAEAALKQRLEAASPNG